MWGLCWASRYLAWRARAGTGTGCWKLFDTRRTAPTAIFRAIEGWYNRERLHSGLGYMTPARKEELAAAA